MLNKTWINIYPPWIHLWLPLQLKKEREQRMRKAAEEEESGEFDDLVSALRSGEVFDMDLSKVNRKKQRRHDFDSSRERPVTKLHQWEASCWRAAETVKAPHEHLSVLAKSYYLHLKPILVYGSKLYTWYSAAMKCWEHACSVQHYWSILWAVIVKTWWHILGTV